MKDILDNLRLQVYLLFPKKLCSNHFRRFESKNVFSLMYGKNPNYFLLFFVAVQNAFAASETQYHLMIYVID